MPHLIVEHTAGLSKSHDMGDLARKMSESAAQSKLLEHLAEAFDLDGPLRRIEVYDNSHIQGTNVVGGMCHPARRSPQTLATLKRRCATHKPKDTTCAAAPFT